MWKKLEEYREKYQMFQTGDVVIAGISGGADSMCLLCVLDTWRKSMGFELVVVHVNHGLRGEEAERDEQYVEAVCAKRALTFEAFHYDVRTYAGQNHLSEEEAGRMLRRQAFEETMKKYKGNKIALAHHKNDNVETFFFHLARGSRLKGLGGMRPVNGKYIRPLLCLQREEIERYLKENHISWVEDATNSEENYTRNRIRSQVVPYFTEQINSKTVEHIDQTMHYFRQVEEYLRTQMEILWKELVTEKADGVLVKQEIAKVPELMRGMIFKEALCRVARKEQDLQDVHVKALEELLERQTGKRRKLPYQMIAQRTYDGIKLSLDKAQNEELPQVDLKLENGQMDFAGYQLEIRVFERTEETGQPPKKRFTKWFDYDIITESVCIRGRKAGDRIVMLQNGGSQKLKQFFINEKIPREMRSRIPVIAEGDQVLWIVGYRQSKAYQVTAQTKRILQIKINGGSLDVRDD